MEIFYERTQRLLGEAAVARLQETHVCVLGVGGVGSWVAEALVRTGISEMSLVDFDTVDITNINRQVQALHSNVGQVKVEAMKIRLLDINPEAIIHCYNEKIEPTNLPTCLDQADFVVDCIDDVAAKVAVIKHCYEQKCAIVSSMGTGNKMGTLPFKISDISKTKVCPLARAVRLRLRKEGIYSGIPVLYSEELPYKEVNSREKPGTVCFSPAIAGLTLAQYIVQEALK